MHSICPSCLLHDVLSHLVKIFERICLHFVIFRVFKFLLSVNGWILATNLVTGVVIPLKEMPMNEVQYFYSGLIAFTSF